MEKCYEYKLKELIHAFVKEFSVGITRQEINDYIYPQMAEDLKTKNNRVRTALTYLRKKEFIENISSDTKSIWVFKKNLQRIEYADIKINKIFNDL